MDRRTFLAILLSLGVYIVWMAFFAPKPPPPRPPQNATSTAVLSDSTARARELPAAAALSFDTGRADTTAAPSLAQTIDVDTPLYAATFSSRGGGLVAFRPKTYTLANGDALHLLDSPTSQPVLTIDPDAGGPAAPVSLEGTVFDVRSEPANGLPIGQIVFSAAGSGGIRVERRYRLRPDDYTIDATVAVSGLPAPGAAEQTWAWSAGLPVTETDPKLDTMEFAGLVRVGDNYERVPLTKFRPGDNAHTYEGAVRWAATRGKYFIAGLFPVDESSTRASVFGDLAAHRVCVGLTFPIPDGSMSTTCRLYVGPIEQPRLVALGDGIDRKVGIKANMLLGNVFGWLATLIHTALVGLYKIIPNYGIAILLIAIVSKAIFFPLSRKSAAQMKAMAAIKPELDALRDRYKDDQQKLGMETMALYKKHGVNPAAGCLPLLIQMPVFFALYGVLRGAIELRHAPFLLWINDLSSPDILASLGKVPFFPDNLHVLPLVMAASTILMQKSTIMGDPRQRSLAYMMPVMMLFFFYNLPAGLNLYWTAQNLLSWAEQALSRGVKTPSAAKAA